MKNLIKDPEIGDVFLMKFDGNGSAQKGWRPGIVIQNNVGNKYSPNVVAIPLTTIIKNPFQPTHVILSARETGLARNSMALCEGPESIPKSLFGNYLTTIPEMYMNRIAKAFLRAYPVLYYLSKDEVSNMKEESYELIAA